MKPARKKPFFLTLVYRALAALAVCLALVLAAVSLYVLVLKDGQAAGGTRRDASQGAAGGEKTFTGIGRMRIPAGRAGNDKAPVVILSVSFPYEPDDRPFAEELAARVRDFRGIITEYIAAADVTELRAGREDELKAGLLGKFNALLRLGRIETLYFNDFLVIE